jgi:cytoskeletal protein RodZ
MSSEPTSYPLRKTNYPEIGSVESRKQIGKELKSAREFQEMSIEQVTAVTKINIRFLENIEDGRWNFLPPTYVKAFIRAYAAAVAIQTEKLSKRLDDLFEETVTSEATFKPELDSATEDMGTGKLRSGGFMLWVEQNRGTFFWSIIGSIVVVLLILYLLRPDNLFTGSQSTESDTTEAETSNEVAPTIPDTSKASLPVVADSANAEVKYLTLELYARDTCFVKVEHADTIVYEQTLGNGSSITLQTPFPALVSFGNAPVMDLTVDGSKLPPFPSSRRVQTVKLGPGGIIGQ